MIYQDKLVKYNRKKGFYLRRRILLISLTVIGLGFAIFIPTYIIYNNYDEVNAKAEEEMPLASLSFSE